MFCSKCGGQVPDGTRFCPNCGTDLSLGKQFANSANNMFNNAEKQMGNAFNDIHTHLPTAEMYPLTVGKNCRRTEALPCTYFFPLLPAVSILIISFTKWHMMSTLPVTAMEKAHPVW